MLSYCIIQKGKYKSVYFEASFYQIKIYNLDRHGQLHACLTCVPIEFRFFLFVRHFVILVLPLLANLQALV